ncbi:MAG: hypothetical protein ACLSAH_11880 [Bilophila wadsworthia]
MVHVIAFDTIKAVATMTQKYTKISDTPTNPCGVECMALLTSSLNMADSWLFRPRTPKGFFRRTWSRR